MGSGKSPGPDGLSAALYKTHWDLVGSEVIQVVLDFVNEGKLLRKYNFTFIALIPKVEQPLNMRQFRPISLCNVLVKLMGKVLANRLNIILPNLISPSQAAFVPGRNITDNVLMAFEVHHHIKKQNTGDPCL